MRYSKTLSSFRVGLGVWQSACLVDFSAYLGTVFPLGFSLWFSSFVLTSFVRLYGGRWMSFALLCKKTLCITSFSRRLCSLLRSFYCVRSICLYIPALRNLREFERAKNDCLISCPYKQNKTFICQYTCYIVISLSVCVYSCMQVVRRNTTYNIFASSVPRVCAVLRII